MSNTEVFSKAAVAAPHHLAAEAGRAILAEGGVTRRDAERIPAALLAVVAGRALGAGRTVGPADALYLRSPDVTLPAGPKRVGT